MGLAINQEAKDSGGRISRRCRVIKFDHGTMSLCLGMIIMLNQTVKSSFSSVEYYHSKRIMKHFNVCKNISLSN